MAEPIVETVAKLRRAACDPNAPTYGSALVPWIDDVTRDWQRLATSHDALVEACRAARDWLGTQAPEVASVNVFRKLDAALKAAGETP